MNESPGISRKEAQWRLFLTAALSLFVELALIRWMGANVIYLGYFSNFVLLACFLGLGLGFLLTKKRFNLIDWAPVMVSLLLGVTVASQIELSLPSHSQVVYFGVDPMSETSLIPIPLILGSIFLGTVALFAAFGQAIGRYFEPFKPIIAYTIDIVGSVTGILAFTAMSFLSIPSYVWFAISGALFIGLAVTSENKGKLLSSQGFRLAVLGAVTMTMLAWASHRDPRATEIRWSPYQFLKVNQADNDMFHITANRVPHQFMLPVSHAEPMYLKPYEIARNQWGKLPENLLIIGAGSGSDVAHALSEGVPHIHAVDIDPVIVEFGEKYNPDKPYSNPNVKVSINDGRHIIQHDDQLYDMIIFALPDSLALLSSQSSVRLESFLFTLESFEQSKARLKPDGILILYNFYRSPYVVERIARTLETVYGHRPKIFNEPSSNLTIIAISDTLKSDAGPVVNDVGPIPTDDWPFLYLRDRSIPTIYIYLVLAIWAITMLLVMRANPRKNWRKGQWPFFFMGAAFLLLETKSIIQFSILFGATWVVNSLVFAGVLIAVLGANAVVHYLKPKNLWPWYALLAAALVLGYLVPINQLTGIDSAALRYGAAVFLLFSPIFFANMIFSRTFAVTEESDHSFGWNILGMMFGGTIEYTSMVLGFQNLAIVVALFYLLAFVFTMRASHTQSPATI